MIHRKQLSVRNWKRTFALPAAILAMAIVGWAQASPQPNRITQELSSGGLIRLPGSVHRLTQKAADMGPVSRGMQLNTLSLHFGPSAEQQIELDALTRAQQDPKSPQYHKWLTQEEYGARFGLSDADLNKVSEWLQSQGLTVRGVSKSRNALYFSGTAAQVETAFHTQIHRYALHGEAHFANATELQLPAALRGVVVMVRGLNDFRPKPASILRTHPVPNFTLTASDHFLTPGDWARIYNVDAIYNAGFTGTGAFVGVVGQTFLPKSDVDHFRSAAGLSSTKLTFVCIDRVSSQCTGASAISDQGDVAEADLDIEWAGGIAKNATVVYLYAPFSVVKTPTINPATSQYYDVFDALQHAVSEYTVPSTHKVLPVISLSYTDCEQSFNGQPAYVTWVANLGQQANSQGQTIVVASGDAGVAGCDSQNDSVASDGASATVPVDSPNFTGVGGTTLSGDVSTPAQFWDQTPWSSSTNVVVSALGYIPETVWNETALNGTLSASGSGVSLFFAKPSWQPTPTNYSGPPGRFIPDVSFAASANHDGYLFCSSDFNTTQYGDVCADHFFSSGGTSGTQVFFPVGGTSAGAPSFAGLLTLLAQKFGPQGNINPTLYGLAADDATYAAVFHDITSGNNNVPCVSGTTGCVGGSGGAGGTPGTMGFSATTGFDLTTGLGSIDAGALYTALGAAADFTVGTPSPSTVTVTAGSSSPPITINVSTAGAYSDDVTFSCSGLPAHASCIFDPAYVSPGSGSASTTLTITTTARAALVPRNVPPIVPPGGPHALWQIALALAGLLLASLRVVGRRLAADGLGTPGSGLTPLHAKRALAVGPALLLIGLCLLQAACGSGGSSSRGTPAGSYVITVNVVGNSNQHSTTLTLNVQ